MCSGGFTGAAASVLTCGHLGRSLRQGSRFIATLLHARNRAKVAVEFAAKCLIQAVAGNEARPLQGPNVFVLQMTCLASPRAYSLSGGRPLAVHILTARA